MSLALLIIAFLLENIETCLEHCKECSSVNEYSSCDTCYYGYYRIAVAIEDSNNYQYYYKCQKCEVSHCNICSSSTPSKCLTCSVGYYLSGDSCASCDSSCYSCENSKDNCISCSIGYYSSNTNSKCNKCDSKCHTCKTTANYCTSCVGGEYLLDSKCFPCDSNCKTCKTTEDYCTSCKNGKYLSNSQCLPCDSNCKTCKTTATNCLSCNIGYYLSSNKCEKCPDICQECENENICTSCINDYFLYNYKCLQCNMNCNTTSDGCKCDSCNDGYYLKNGQCLQCDSLCETCSQEDLCTKCITDYYKKENDPLNNGQNFKCYKDPERYYLDNDIYRKCYQSCKMCSVGGNKTFHNCVECDANLPFEIKRNDYINCYPNCTNYYYFDNGDNFHCTSDKSCPDEYPFLLENKFECIEIILEDILNNLLGNGLNGTESREEEIIFYDNILSTLEDGFTSNGFNTSDIENGKEQILKAEKLTITFTTLQNQKNNINNNLNNDMTNIDLGDCENSLRGFYHIPDNEPLYMKKIDVIQDGMKTLKVEYDIYAKLFGENLIKLNLTMCEKSKISISIPINITEEMERLNSSSAYYNDICYTTTSEDGTDITMKDRQNEFINKDRVLCQDGCYLIAYDYDNLKANCSCSVKKCSQSYEGMDINKEKILDNFEHINNLINFKFLVCYKTLFNKEGIIKNIGCYILSSIIIFHIITIFIFSLKQFSSLIKKIEKITSEKYPAYSNKKGKFVEPIIYQIVRRMYNGRKFGKKRNTHNKIVKKDSELQLNYKNNSDKNNKEDIKKYIDEEINGFSYDLSLKNDKRTYCQYYISLLKTQHSLICALFNHNDYNSGIIKINLFVIGLAIEYIVNALFYNDDTMHKIYEDKGLFDLETQLPIAFYSTIISTILNYPLNFLALSNYLIIDFKNDMSKINIKLRIKKLKKILTVKFTLYFIISFLFLLFFWYYISIFGVIYPNTQIHLLKDTLVSIALSLIFPFIIYLLPGIFRLPSLSINNKQRKCLYNFSKILQSF